ncbi:MAG: heavy metal translocating P-type ATPase [Burkholderiaceae bacterium]|nr:heavy metal translocating P-type ATPase [Burkholderiaceae bacterium]
MAWQSSFCPRMEIGMSDKSASVDRHAPGPRLNISCCSSDSTCAAPSRTDSAHAQHTDTAGHADHDHDHSSLPGPRRIAAALLAATGAELLHLLGPQTQAAQSAGMALAAVAILLAGLGIYRSGVQALLRGQLGVNALMALAVTGAFAIGQWPEAAMVMALYALAEHIEQAAVGRARHAISALLALSPDQADLLDAQGQWRSVPVAQVALGSTLRLRPGGRVPLDGVVTSGHSAVDESSLSGESLAVDKAPGDRLYAGTLNAQSELQWRVTAVAGQTTLDSIIHAVEQAQAVRAPTQRLVDRFAAVYTPAVFVLALLVAVGAPLLLQWTWLDALYRALVLLVIACPCALVLSTPVTVVSALAAAARRGIVIKGGQWLEQARGIRVVALDKTGTITCGRPVLVGQALTASAPTEAASHSNQAIYAVAAALARRSDHPVSIAIAAGLASASTPQPEPTLDAFTALAGRGVQARIAGSTWQLGNRRWMQERGLWTPAAEDCAAAYQAQGHSVTLLADEHAVRAAFAVADTVRPEAAQAVADLHALGIATALLSGDHAAPAQAAAHSVGISDVQAGLLPADKLAALATLHKKYGMAAMVGDGINDAPALAQADIGFAMGAAGTDVALETADIVIMNDDLRRIAETVRLSRRAHRVLVQNVTLALGIKLVFFGLALTGQATMWMAVFADMGASLLVVGNGLRMLRPSA